MAAIASLAAGVVASLVAPAPGGDVDKQTDSGRTPVSLPDLAEIAGEVVGPDKVSGKVTDQVTDVVADQVANKGTGLGA